MENKKVIKNESVVFTNVPPALEGIEYGDILVVANFPDTHEYTEIQRYAKDLRVVADEYIAMCFAENLPIVGFVDSESPEIIKRIIRENGYTGDFNNDVDIEFYADQLIFFDKKPGAKDEADAPKTYSIVNKKHNADVMDKMKSMVDKERLKALFGIAVNGREIKDDVVDLYLDKWANAKYDWFMAFGQQLIIRTPIEFTMDPNEMAPLVKDLYKRFPMYAANLFEIEKNGGMDAFVNNKMPRSAFFRDYAPNTYKEGMKVSKFLSALYKSNGESNSLQEKFDIELSKVMQDRIVNGYVNVSIDPYDFLTCSVNMHNWTTCQELWGNMNGACFSWITDPCALIAYRDNGKEYEYTRFVGEGVNGVVEHNFGKNKFRGNSKSWRQMIHTDPKTCAMLFSREYPKNMDNIKMTEAIRSLLENTIGRYIGVENWDNYGDIPQIAGNKRFGHLLYKDTQKHHYSDVGNWEQLTHTYKIRKSLVVPENTDMTKVQVTAGGKLYCACCGKEITGGHTYALCNACM